MDALVETGKYVTNIKTYTTTMGYYVIKFLSESYTDQEDTTCDGKISTYGELIAKSQSMYCIKDNTKCYWGKSQQQKNIIVPTRTIVYTCLDVMTLTEAKQIHMNLCNRNQVCKALQICPICITDTYHDFILGEIKCQYIIEYQRDMSVDNKED